MLNKIREGEKAQGKLVLKMLTQEIIKMLEEIRQKCSREEGAEIAGYLKNHFSGKDALLEESFPHVWGQISQPVRENILLLLRLTNELGHGKMNFLTRLGAPRI
jgi:hypothetical protein